MAALAAGTVLGTVALGAPAAADTTLHARLVAQNRSGGGGTVLLTLTDDGDLRVRIRATGLMPGPHAQHLHGSLQGGEFRCASMASDTDGDGWLTNEEATGEYGSAMLALTTRGDTTATSMLDLSRMPVADARGRLRYDRTIPAEQVPDGLARQLVHLHVVQHGIDANRNGRYDLAALGESTFAAGLGLNGVPEEATDPATCGMVTGAAAGHAPHGGVATGGGRAVDMNLPTDADSWAEWVVSGLGLLALSLGVLLRRRGRRGRQAARG